MAQRQRRKKMSRAIPKNRTVSFTFEVLIQKDRLRLPVNKKANNVLFNGYGVDEISIRISIRYRWTARRQKKINTDADHLQT